MILLGQLDRRIGERAAALVGRAGALHGLSQPRSCPRGIAGMRGAAARPRTCRPSAGAQVFGHQLVLGREMPVERHLVGAGRLGNRLNAHRADAEPVKQIAGRRQNALRGGICEFARLERPFAAGPWKLP
jgi:hypothetical protein